MKNLFRKIFIIGTLLFLAGCGGPAAPGKYADAAKCLKDKGVIMYGAYWCPHCAQQKKNFGDDFQFVHYQECDPQGPNGNKVLCLQNGVTQYPTWKFPGQADLVGEQQVRDLAKLANCQDKLPADEQKILQDEANAVTEANQNPGGDNSPVPPGAVPAQF